MTPERVLTELSVHPSVWKHLSPNVNHFLPLFKFDTPTCQTRVLDFHLKMLFQLHGVTADRGFLRYSRNADANSLPELHKGDPAEVVGQKCIERFVSRQ